MGLYGSDFSKVFSELLEIANVSCYKINDFSSLDEGYLSRLKNGERCNPSPETIMRISLALTHHSKEIRQHHIENLFKSVGRSLFRNRDHINLNY